MNVRRSFLALFFLFVLVLNLLSPVLTVSADETKVNGEFIAALLNRSEIETSYPVADEVLSAVYSKSGSDDLYKTYFLLGDSTGKYKQKSQSFNNGKYSDGSFTVDHSHLSEFVSEALRQYCALSGAMNEEEKARARSVISYGYGHLSAMDRIKIKNAPFWLVGGYYGELGALQKASDMKITTVKGETVQIFTDGIRKITGDGYGYKQGILIDADKTECFDLHVPDKAEYFTCIFGMQIAPSDLALSDTYAKVSLILSDGSVRDNGIYCIYGGCENKIEIKTDGAESIRFELCGKYPDGKVKLIVADPLFLGKGGVLSTSGTVGTFSKDKYADINRDGWVSRHDIDALKLALIGVKGLDASSCDLSRDGAVDYFDVLCLENYLLYLENMNNEYNGPSALLKVTSLGDSIARGYGLDGSEEGRPSPLAYGNLVSSALGDLTEYTVDFKNYGTDGDKTEDLLEKLGEDEELRSRIASSQLVNISIGGNDFIQSVLDAVVREFSLEPSGTKEMLTEIGKIDHTKLSAFIAGDKIDSSVDERAQRYESELRLLLSEIKALSPDATVIVTTIPNTATDTDVYKKVNIPLAGSSDFKICNLYSAVDEWLCYFNEVIMTFSQDEEGVLVADLTSVFVGDPVLTLMKVAERVYLNDLAQGDFSAIENADIHPSAEGHLEMSKVHLSLLDEAIQEWNGTYVRPEAPNKDYLYSETFSEGEIKLDSQIKKTKDGLISYKASVDKADTYENLLVTLAFDENLLSFKSIELDAADGVSYFVSDGYVKILASKEASLDKVFTFSAAFERKGEGNQSGEFELLARESRLTHLGHSKAEGSVTDKVDLETLDYLSENDPDPGDGSSTPQKGIVYAVFAVVFIAIVISAILALVALKKGNLKKIK